MIEKIKKNINLENKDVNNMSSREMLELLTKLNKCLRCLDCEEEVRTDGMEAGDLVAPTREIQNMILEYLMNNINSIQDIKVKAAVMYYTLLNLHMFMML